MKTKLKLDEISLKSFVTEQDASKAHNLKAGIDETEWCSREMWACQKTVIGRA
ncbi:MAG: pinensin family lanthipeptide [Cyclobacteriaceae bacterium]